MNIIWYNYQSTRRSHAVLLGRRRELIRATSWGCSEVDTGRDWWLSSGRTVDLNLRDICEMGEEWHYFA